MKFIICILCLFVDAYKKRHCENHNIIIRRDQIKRKNIEKWEKNLNNKSLKIVNEYFQRIDQMHNNETTKNI